MKNLSELKNDFIGLFDSGFGGISVLNQCLKQMPNENYVFYADSKNCPYGKRTKENIVEIGIDIISKFNMYNPKSLIIACGTMSTSDPLKLRAQFPNLDIIGTYPDFEHLLKPYDIISEELYDFRLDKKLSITKHRLKVLILATTATCNSEYIKDKLKSFKGLIDVYAEPADAIVKAVENDEVDSFHLRNELENILMPYRDVDYVVLGCTHFPFAKKVIKSIITDKAIFTSGCEIAANICYRHLLEKKSTNTHSGDKKYSIIFVDTNLDDKRKATFLRLLDADKDKYNIEYLSDLI